MYIYFYFPRFISRTAVLFTRKAQAALKRPSEQPVKEESSSTSSAAAAAASLTSTSSSNSSSLTLGGGGGSNITKHAHLSPLNSSVGAVLSALSGASTSASLVKKSPKRNSRHKRISEMRRSASMSPKKSPHTVRSDSMPSTSAAAAAAAAASEAITYNSIPDSFRVYRANTTRDGSESDDDDLSDISGSPCSSCSGFSVSGSGTEYDTSDTDEDDDEEDDEDDDDDDTDEDDDEEDDEDADAEEVKGNAMKTVGGTAIAEPENQDVEMRDITAAIIKTATAVNVAAATATGNGETAMSGCESEEDEEDANTNTNNTASSTARTPTPSEAKIPTKKAALIKQHNITKANATSTPALAAAATATIVTSSLLSSAAVMAATPKSTLKAATRSASKHLFAGGGATVNNSKTKNNIATNDIVLNNIDRTHNTRTNSTMNNVESTSSLHKPPLEPLQLVWAKCRGYPWYPALILDPKTPKGFVYNGVPLPAPPADVLGLRKNYQEDVFLVLFFDAKRTWQWLPANKLEILGIDKDLDQNKLVESRKPTDRKAVKKAYQDALHYQSQVSDLEGQGPDPIM